jgi:hypothetical protein
MIFCHDVQAGDEFFSTEEIECTIRADRELVPMIESSLVFQRILIVHRLRVIQLGKFLGEYACKVRRKEVVYDYVIERLGSHELIVKVKPV